MIIEGHWITIEEFCKLWGISLDVVTASALDTDPFPELPE